jgi:hypothetical protein
LKNNAHSITIPVKSYGKREVKNTFGEIKKTPGKKIFEEGGAPYIKWGFEGCSKKSIPPGWL